MEKLSFGGQEMSGNVGKCGEIWGNTSTDLPIFSANIEGLTEGQSKSAAG